MLANAFCLSRMQDWHPAFARTLTPTHPRHKKFFCEKGLSKVSCAPDRSQAVVTVIGTGNRPTY
jgi:hypothetical protein